MYSQAGLLVGWVGKCRAAVSPGCWLEQCQVPLGAPEQAVCVCVCVCERERERELCVCVCVCVRYRCVYDIVGSGGTVDIRYACVVWITNTPSG